MRNIVKVLSRMVLIAALGLLFSFMAGTEVKAVDSCQVCLYVDPSEGGTTNPEPSFPTSMKPYHYNPGEVINITAIPNNGYIFRKRSATGGGTFADEYNASTIFNVPDIYASGVTAYFDEAPTITFDANGGSVTPTSAQVETNRKLASPPTPTWSGHTCTGWYTAATDGDPVTTDTEFTTDTTIYAHWEVTRDVKYTQLGANVLSNNAGANGASTVYYGKNNQTWGVIGYGTTGVASTSGKLALLAGSNMGTDTKFNEYEASQDCNDYAGSILNGAVDAIYSSTYFTEKEMGAIIKRDLLRGEYDSNHPYDCDGISGTALTGYNAPYLWPLSTKEAYTLYDNGSGITNIGDEWWLRSPGSSANDAAFVSLDGYAHYDGLDVNYDGGVRPAFNLNLSSIILTSAASGGKSSGTTGAGALTATTAYGGSNGWKLTLLDSSRNFSAERTDSGGVTAGSDISISYTGAETGNNEYVSAILLDSSDNLLYYGRIVDKSTGSADGTASITIPEDLAVGTYTIKLFSEQYHTGKETDYASAFSDPISITVKNAPTANDFTVLLPSDTVYDGSSKTALATTASGVTGMGDITVKYKDANDNVSTTAPTDPGTYKVLLDVAEGDSYNAANDITDDWTFTISEAGPVAKPTFSPAEGKYYGTQRVEISCTTDGADIHYTTNGNDPDENSDIYSSAITVSEGMSIKAVGIKHGWTSSEIAKAVYTIEEPPAEYWTVTFDPNASDASGKMDAQKIEKGKTDKLKANKYTREGFTFDSWNTKKDGSGTKYADKASFKPKGDTTLYAQWKEVKKYAVIVTAEPENGGTVKSSVSSGKSGTKVTITAAAGKDFLFKEWKVIAGGVELADSKQPETTFIIKNADVKVTAIFEVKEPDTYTVTATTDGHGNATANPTSGNSGTKVTLKAVSDAGYKFKKWKVVSGGIELTDATKAKTTFKIKNANIKVKAIFEKIYEAPQPNIEPKDEDKIILAWWPIDEAKGYDIFMSRCNYDDKKITPRLVKTIKNKNTTQWTATDLMPKTSYKAYVKAYTKDKNGKKKYISKSPLMHVYTAGGTKNYTNAKSIKLDKSDGKIKKGNKLTLKVKETYKIKASVKKADKRRKLMPDKHVKTLRYRSSDPGVASVGASGKITAKKPGKCVVYVYAHNGVNKKINVIVK